MNPINNDYWVVLCFVSHQLRRKPSVCTFFFFFANDNGGSVKWRKCKSHKCNSCAAQSAWTQMFIPTCTAKNKLRRQIHALAPGLVSSLSAG